MYRRLFFFLFLVVGRNMKFSSSPFSCGRNKNNFFLTNE
jgi:hypothetical protein